MFPGLLRRYGIADLVKHHFEALPPAAGQPETKGEVHRFPAIGVRDVLNEDTNTWGAEAQKLSIEATERTQPKMVREAMDADSRVISTIWFTRRPHVDFIPGLHKRSSEESCVIAHAP
jgi:hypothetical protein